MSATKVRAVLDLIRGETVQRAGEILQFTERDAAEVVGKCLASAVANAVNNDGQTVGELLRAGLLRGRGPHAQALAAPRPGPGHPDPQAHHATSR